MEERSNIVLTGKDIDSQAFAAAMQRLLSHPFSSPKLSYTLGYIGKKVQSFTKDIITEHSKLVQKYSEKDENGNPTMQFSEENKEAYSKALEEIHAITYEINKKPLDVDVINQEQFKFSANDISALEPLLCGLED